MRRQKSAKTKSNSEEPKATKTLGVRYAELLKLRKASRKDSVQIEALVARRVLCPEARSCVLISLA